MLRSLISTIGIAAVSGQITATVRRVSRRAALGAAAAVMWLVALAFAIAAFTVWLTTVVGIIWALLIVAAIFGVVGLVLSVTLAMTANRQPASPFQQPLAGLAASGGQGSGSLFGSLAVLIVLGWLLGRQIKK